MTPATRLWVPSILLAAGAVLTLVGVRAQRRLELREPLARAIPDTIAGQPGSPMILSDDERRVAGVTDYLLRAYGDSSAARDSAAGGTAFQIYVGFYDQQMQGKTIHSPKNCLPGAGWEALTSSVALIPTDQGDVQVNRYLISNKERRALVLYWYQGRGRVAANEYLVKWNLLRDAALRRRSDEALVRIVVPIEGSEAQALSLATSVARNLVSEVRAALPA